MSNPEQAPAQRAAPDTAEEYIHLAPSRLLLVRHGESTWNVAHRIQGQLDPPLSEQGFVQARELAARLAGHELAGFYTSDLCRAHQTAEPIELAVGRQATPMVGLREIALGEWEGKTRHELMVEYPEQWARWSRHPSWDIVPGGEGAAPFQHRVTETLEELRRRHPEGDVLCVTHGGVIQVALLNVVGRHSTGLFPFLIENASLTVVQRMRGRTVVTAVNDTCHLS
jgi:2,3-bisphosphoglycerate-dependent phosphoglycerate mutase